MFDQRVDRRFERWIVMKPKEVLAPLLDEACLDVGAACEETTELGETIKVSVAGGAVEDLTACIDGVNAVFRTPTPDRIVMFEAKPNGIDEIMTATA